jgi:hypothetical protein
MASCPSILIVHHPLVLIEVRKEVRRVPRLISVLPSYGFVGCDWQ